MAVRHRLRRQLRTLRCFLDPLSASALRPAASVAEIREVEAALQVCRGGTLIVKGQPHLLSNSHTGQAVSQSVWQRSLAQLCTTTALLPLQAPLPWELFELYRWADGQAPARGGSLQFIDAAGLLSLQEMRQAAQDRCGPLTLARAFERQLTTRGAPPGQGSGGSRGGGGGSSTEASAWDGAVPSGSSSSSCGSGCTGDRVMSAAAAEQAGGGPEVLLPFSSELRGRKRYCLDLSGRVWLSSGFNNLLVAPSLTALIRRVLT
jgi:hypothetical protein